MNKKNFKYSFLSWRQTFTIYFNIPICVILSFCQLYQQLILYQKQNGDCQDLYLNFCHSSNMPRKNLIAINKRIDCIKMNQICFEASEELFDFYLLAVNLHEKIRQYLRLECLSAENTEASELDSQQSIIKSQNLPFGWNIENQQDLFIQSEEETEQKSMNQIQTLKWIKQKKLKPLKQLPLNNQYKELIENVNLIILYQNKVDYLLKSINNQQNMTQIYLNQNQFDFNQLNLQNRDNQPTTFHFQQIKDNIQKLIVQCKELKDHQDQLKLKNSKQSVRSINSQCSTTSKKSLLTEMLKMSDTIQIQNSLQSPPIKTHRKPHSVRNTTMTGNRLLIKEIDFSGYKMEQISGRKQKKAIRQNSSQCSKCAIF